MIPEQTLHRPATTRLATSQPAALPSPLRRLSALSMMIAGPVTAKNRKVETAASQPLPSSAKRAASEVTIL